MLITFFIRNKSNKVESISSYYQIRCSVKLIFVYNADSDLTSAVLGYAHKVLSPSTYKCSLCSLTHSHLGQRTKWKRFKEEAPMELNFMYIKQFEKEFGQNLSYPVVLELIDDKNVIVVCNHNEIARMKSVDFLMEALTSYYNSNQFKIESVI